eukprot:scaffold2756_cov376-Prasinococcus_capsulatus_cf.AAC.1
MLLLLLLLVAGAARRRGAEIDLPARDPCFVRAPGGPTTGWTRLHRTPRPPRHVAVAGARPGKWAEKSAWWAPSPPPARRSVRSRVACSSGQCSAGQRGGCAAPHSNRSRRGAKKCAGAGGSARSGLTRRGQAAKVRASSGTVVRSLGSALSRAGEASRGGESRIS